mgnify:CR=1 FL=1
MRIKRILVNRYGKLSPILNTGITIIIVIPIERISAIKYDQKYPIDFDAIMFLSFINTILLFLNDYFYSFSVKMKNIVDYSRLC